MSMLLDLAALLEGAVPETRVYPGKADDDAVFPYLIYSRNGVEREAELGGNSQAGALRNSVVQIDIYAELYSDALGMAEAVEAALQEWEVDNSIEREQDLTELEVDVHRISMDVSIWHN